MRIGYARVSSDDQNASAQRAALKKARCSKIFTETASGGYGDRAQLKKAIAILAKGDQLVVWKLDRLSRSLLHILQLLVTIEKQGAGFRSITEAIDTTTPGGRAMMQMLGLFAEYERGMIIERTRAGLAHAKANGQTFGRPRKLSGGQILAALELLRTRTQFQAADVLGVSERTLGRALKRWRDGHATEPQKAKQHGTQTTKGAQGNAAGTAARA